MDAGDHDHVDYRETDVSDWLRFEEEELGTKPKRWLINPANDERWLMKYATFSQPRGGPEYRKGDDWAERVAWRTSSLPLKSTWAFRHGMCSSVTWH